jgi:malate synthase
MVELPEGVQVLAKISPEFLKVLTPAALKFIARLQRIFGPTRTSLLYRRQEIQAEIYNGKMPDFLKETSEIRQSEWKVAQIPSSILDRRVEITGPVDRKMVINALNSGAQIYMADFEDSHSPTWRGTIEGQINLYDAIRRNIQFSSFDGKEYALKEKTATLFVRPRGWHLVEKHVLVDGEPMAASLFDFGLYIFHNLNELTLKGKQPFFYLPKMESYLEARLWNDVFLFAQEELGHPKGTIRATVLIETILAAFQMDEILYELREHSAGLNCGRWDYIFSMIKKFSQRPDFVFPDRALVTMNEHFLNSYCQLLIHTCHKRGIHAMGGMAAQIPIKDDPQKNALAMEKVRADKKREVRLGHDGTWVAHPGLVSVAKEVFDQAMPNHHQIRMPDQPCPIQASDLLQVPTGEMTRQGLESNTSVALHYLEAWLRGSGCVPLHSLMEDAATAEISRAQIWQWIKHGKIKASDFTKVLSQEMRQIRTRLGEEGFQAGKYDLAGRILTEIATSHEFVEFLTVQAYSYL